MTGGHFILIAAHTPVDESIVTADLCHEVDLREKVLVSGSDELLTSAKNKLARFDLQQQPSHYTL